MCPESSAELTEVPSLASLKLTIRTTVKPQALVYNVPVSDNTVTYHVIFLLYFFFKWFELIHSISALAVPC